MKKLKFHVFVTMNGVLIPGANRHAMSMARHEYSNTGALAIQSSDAGMEETRRRMDLGLCLCVFHGL